MPDDYKNEEEHQLAIKRNLKRKPSCFASSYSVIDKNLTTGKRKILANFKNASEAEKLCLKILKNPTQYARRL